MTKPYSMDLRERVVAAVLAGGSCRAVAERFSIGVSSVVRWAQRYCSIGTAAARPMGGARRIALVEERDWLLARIAAKPDLTLRALVSELEARGTPASYGAVWRFCEREGLSFKKDALRRGAGPAGRRPPPTALESASGQRRSAPPRLHR